MLPNLLSWPGSVIVLDIKHENYAVTAGYRGQGDGQKAFKWAPMEAHSHCYNPLDWVTQDGSERISDLQLLATILLPPPAQEIVFKENARPILVQKIHYYSDRAFTRRILPPPPVPALDVRPPPPRPRRSGDRRTGPTHRPRAASGGAGCSREQYWRAAPTGGVPCLDRRGQGLKWSPALGSSRLQDPSICL